ncbi:unnamed protein product [Leptosia nina]|uniref:Glucose-1-phosphatase n=1 Tax=Leptosia nina TaxID=320188 RepID=A0AAV1JDJ3_9NEOP
MLEGYMASYFKNWLDREGLLPIGCPSCDIKINHSNDTYDPVFSPYIHNGTDSFKRIAIDEMNSVLESLNLKTEYENMENILEYPASELCKIETKCNMASEENALNITVGKKPYLSGPLKLCNEAIDAFFMEYYSGLSLDNVAWGKLSELSDWQKILPLTYGYHNTTYNTTHIATDLAKPLIKYISNIFVYETTKVTLLMGHDANINVLLRALDFHHFILDNEFVSTPIGGKIVFQKWRDLTSKEELLKINYIYHSIEQIRNATILSENNKPKTHLLQLKHCRCNEAGFCPWSDFIDILNNFNVLQI